MLFDLLATIFIDLDTTNDVQLELLLLAIELELEEASRCMIPILFYDDSTLTNQVILISIPIYLVNPKTKGLQGFEPEPGGRGLQRLLKTTKNT